MMEVCTSDGDDDIQITKVVSVKKPMSWVAPSFDDFKCSSQPMQRSQSTPATKGGFSTQLSSSSAKSWKKNPSVYQSSIKQAFTPDINSRKRPRDTVQKNLSSQGLLPTKQVLKASHSPELWCNKYAPSSRAELAVHKKKVEEIADWLDKTSTKLSKRGSLAGILLLTGPPGAGKTACVKVLSRELGWNLQEWAGTLEQAADQWTSTDDSSRREQSRVDVYQSQSQSAVFHNFLLRANKYQALDMTSQNSSDFQDRTANHCSGGGAVIVVEEMPNVFYRDSQQFHDILRNYKRCGRSPLVFIMSDSNNNSSAIQKLFPKDLQQECSITNICMNPVAPTMLVKLLNKVAIAEAGKFQAPSTAVIETVAVSSGGDICSALNTLQFACGKDTQDLKAMCAVPRPQPKKQGSVSGARLKYGSSRTRGEQDSALGDPTMTLGTKDKAVFLFQSIGKILHFKRGNPADQPRIPALPVHLSYFDRDPLLVDPEDVAFKSQLSGDSLTSFLHENYVEFLSSVEDLERAADYFSDADYLSALWMAREELQRYSVSVATRGFIHSNSEITRHNSPHRSRGWLPLHKSRWFSTSKQANANVISARQLFKGYHWEPEVLCTEILPFISLTNPTLHDPGQIRFVQEMTTFSKSTQILRTHLERLNEKDVVLEEEEKDGADASTKKPTKEDQAETRDDSNFLSSQSKIQALQEDNDNADHEDIVIEEFDDDDDFGDFMFP